MSGIYIYRGKVDSSVFSSVKALLVFGEDDFALSIPNTKYFSLDEARKGLEQLKRWVSTGAFRTVVLSNFLAALERGNSEHIREWLEDHSSEPDFPTLILVNDGENKGLAGLLKNIESKEKLARIIES